MSTTGCFLHVHVDNKLVNHIFNISFVFSPWFSHKSKKDRKHNKKKEKKDNNDVHYTTQKTKDGATRTPLKPRMNSCALNIHIL
jgi:hypothetical protein